MPVRKYRSVEEMSEMEDSFWVPPGTPEHIAAVRRVLEYAALFGTWKNNPRGVFKYRSMEEAQAQREEWERLGRTTK